MYCMVYVLYDLCIVRYMYCMIYVLYGICTVSCMYCTVYVLYDICIVWYMYCMMYVLYDVEYSKESAFKSNGREDGGGPYCVANLSTWNI